VLAAWPRDYNEVRPHSGLGAQTSASMRLSPCSPASRPLRVGFTGGLRPVLAQAARDDREGAGQDGKAPLDQTKKHRHCGRDGDVGLCF